MTKDLKGIELLRSKLQYLTFEMEVEDIQRIADTFDGDCGRAVAEVIRKYFGGDILVALSEEDLEEYIRLMSVETKMVAASQAVEELRGFIQERVDSWNEKQKEK